MYQNLVLAGTFDHLHSGHQLFIKTSLKNAEKVWCGITTDWISQEKVLPVALQSFKQRLEGLNNLFEQKKVAKKVKIFPLTDYYGPAIISNKLEAITVTKESYDGAIKINKKRLLKGLKPLAILSINLIKTTDQKTLSSTRIRLGEVNRRGLLYQQLLPENKTLYLPTQARAYFKQPLGRLLTGTNVNLSWAGLKALKIIRQKQFSFIITVGDITTQAFVLNNLPINLAIIDYRCQRQPIPFNLHQQLKTQANFSYQVNNDPATLSAGAIKILAKMMPKLLLNQQLGIIRVNGEEDLLVLGAILLSPLKTAIFYGQPNKGIVQVEVTEKLKEKVVSLIKKFKSS